LARFFILELSKLATPSVSLTTLEVREQYKTRVTFDFYLVVDLNGRDYGRRLRFENHFSFRYIGFVYYKLAYYKPIHALK